jgi:lycopene beta-cyclase
MYVLPWTTTTLLVEDTYYSNNSDLNLDALRKGIVHYCDARDWRIKKVLSEEVGRLPIPLGGHPPHRRYSFPVSGVRGGLFHPTTSYSFAKAVHFANFLCVMPEYHAESLLFYARNYAERHWRGGSFFRFLNRMMFQAATPHLRYRILERFYRLPASLIQHFYSGQMTLSEKARLLLGRPTVPVLSALDCLLFTPKRIRGVGRIIPRFGESR